MKKLSIIIPAKNEEKRIARTLSNYASFFISRKDLKPEIIVVISNSKDSTSKIVDDYSYQYPFIKKLSTSYDVGKGGAVAMGFKNSIGDYVGFTDADGAVSPSEFYKLYEFLDETPWLDGSIGSRTLGNTKMSFRRKIISRIFNLYVKLFFNLPYKDTQCGAKIFRREVALSIAKRLSKTGWSFDVNLLLVARYLNFKVLEFPILWQEKEGSKISVYTGFVSILFEFISLKIMELRHIVDVETSLFVKTSLAPKRLKETKNILVFAWRDIKHLESGGSEIYVHNIAKRLAEKHNVTLFTSQPGNLHNKDIIDNVKIIRKGNFLTVYFWAFVYYLKFFRKKTDYIIDVENGIPFFTPLYSRKRKLMILHHVHKKQWFKQFPFPIAILGYIAESFIMPLVYRKTPVVTVSPSSLEELKSIGFSEKRIYLAYNSIPDKVGGTFRKSYYPLIVYIGRVKAYKRIEIGIKALSNLLKVFPNLTLVIGGFGDHLEPIRKIVKKLGLEDSVEILGFISERKKWEYLQKAWAFIMPSMKEGWGVTIMEAASCSTPSLGFNVPGVRDSVRNGITGLLAEKESDFEKNLKSVLSNPTLRKKLGDNGKKWSSFFTWNSTFKVFEGVITKLDNSEQLLSDRTYPWELDLRSEAVTSLVDGR